MKKSIFILVMFTLVTSGVFAQISLSAGGGALFDWSFNNGLSFSEPGFGSVSLSIDNMSPGAYAFFDATFVEAEVNFAYGWMTEKLKAEELGYGSFSYKYTYGSLQLGFSVLGKFPFDLGFITLFPLLGLDYNIVLAVFDDEFWGDSMDLNQLGFLAGVGVDYDLTKYLYLRGEALFHLRLPSKLMNDLSMGGATKDLGIGPRIKVGVGYRFF